MRRGRCEENGFKILMGSPLSNFGYTPLDAVLMPLKMEPEGKTGTMIKDNKDVMGEGIRVERLAIRKGNGEGKEEEERRGDNNLITKYRNHPSVE